MDFSLSAEKVAQALLGQYLCRRYNDGRVEKHIITEVEAYLGEEDKACHAHKGKTKRTAVMYGPGGHWYVYLIYGMYYMLNLVTAPLGRPEAVLIRGLRDIDGPGRLTKQLLIDKSFNGLLTSPKNGLWIEKNKDIKKRKIIRLPRVGVDYAEEWKDKLLRFKLVGYTV